MWEGAQKMAYHYWTQITHFLKKDEYQCSNCGNMFYKPYAICPACGVKMKKVKYEPTWVDEADEYDMLFEDF